MNMRLACLAHIMLLLVYVHGRQVWHNHTTQVRMSHASVPQHQVMLPGLQSCYNDVRAAISASVCSGLPTLMRM